MTKVKLLTDLALEKELLPTGKVVDLEETLATHLVEIGSAVAVESDDGETTDEPLPVNATNVGPIEHATATNGSQDTVETPTPETETGEPQAPSADQIASDLQNELNAPSTQQPPAPQLPPQQ